MNLRDRMLAAAIVGLALFALLAADQVAQGIVYGWDFPVDDAMTRLDEAGWPIHAWGNALSFPGSRRFAVPAMVAATAALLAWGQKRRAAWCLGVGTFAGVLNVTLKALFQRPLPPFIFDRYPSYAFPSGHTMGAAATVGVALLLLAEGAIEHKRLDASRARSVRLAAGGVWVAVSFAVGVGRVLAQHHWVSDVLAAWALSGALVLGTLLASTPRRAAAF